MNKPLLLFTLIISIASAGCAKHSVSPQAQQQSSLSAVVLTTQIPVPDKSYEMTSAQAASAGNPGLNVQNLVSQIDMIALPLKERNSHLGQVQKEGVSTFTDPNLHIVHAILGADLVGVRDSSNSNVTWTYQLNGTTYFTGSSSLDGISGSLNFPASQLAGAINLSWTSSFLAGGALKRTISVNSTTTSNQLVFVATYAPGTSADPSVQLSGSVGQNQISGQWNSAGGYYQLGSNAKVCWVGGSLQDTTNAQRPDICPSI
jgi:hypothetical protein